MRFTLLTLLTLPLHAQTLALPGRAADALSGAELIKRITPLGLAEREKELSSQIVSGNVPNFLRTLCPVRVTSAEAGQTNAATFFVTPDYLAVGSDDDYFLAPLSPNTAQGLADALACSLPTRKMVDAIYAAAAVKLPPAPIPPSPAMTSVPVFSQHNAVVRAQRVAQLAMFPLGALVAGHKKDVVISARLATAPGKVAIYGWHQTNGAPIQSLYLGHTAAWVDYSQCVRLVQQKLAVNGVQKTVAEVLGDPALAGLLSDEGAIANPRYSKNASSSPQPNGAEDPAARWNSNSLPERGASLLTGGSNGFNGFQESQAFEERVASFAFEPEVRIHLNAPAISSSVPRRPVLLIFYALPNGNTIEQTIGKAPQPGEDWHYDIQHIGAQTRFLRQLLTEREIVVAYLESGQKSWPAWRKKHGDKLLPEIVAGVKGIFRGAEVETILSGHSGGGSFIFGYLNAVESIPMDVARIAFLDSNYAYESALGHKDKLVQWLKAGDGHFLCVLAYNDAVALLDGKPFVSAAGGTWGKSHTMQADLAQAFAFASLTNADFQTFTALGGRVQFILKENSERKIFHTVQVERNGFIHALVSGTAKENVGYEYFGPRAYSNWIEKP